MFSHVLERFRLHITKQRKTPTACANRGRKDEAIDLRRSIRAKTEGKSILAFYSTAKQGEISRVVPQLPAGTVVTVPRMDTHFLVSEHGVANLKGKSTRDRALAIIGLAHPRFRDGLLKEAERMYLL